VLSVLSWLGSCSNCKCLCEPSGSITARHFWFRRIAIKEDPLLWNQLLLMLHISPVLCPSGFAPFNSSVGFLKYFLRLKYLERTALFRDPRRLDFGGTVPILRAVFRVPPAYMAGHTFVPLFETFGLH
jgi:hypothetical protein